jgi:UbiD family decarboxylase
MIPNLQSLISLLRKEKEIIDIKVEVDPYLEAAEIHRRVVAEEGPALLFTNIQGASFPLVTNLFGTKKRVDLALGREPVKLIRSLVAVAEHLAEPPLKLAWNNRGLLSKLARVGLKRTSSGPVLDNINLPPKLGRLPLLTTWKQDGGPFITLPLVYTEHPTTGVHNLGMYRIQRFDDSTTGLHCQIGKGGGFHLAAAKELGQKLPVNIFVGGPPALILSAIAPLPENVPELLLASFVMGKKLQLAKNPIGPLPIAAEAEFVLVGEVDPNELRPEGPFGDHYGYYSLKHDYPVFRCKSLFHRKNAVFAATVVGKPRQEDFFLGDYLQEFLSPLFPLVMPTVKELWSYGETGFHSLACARVVQRYKREAMVSAFRVLGEGQLSLTKFLLVVDGSVNVRDFKSVLKHVLERADFRSDLYLLSNLAMDTLDYTGPKVNEGSKGVLLGVGDPIRELPGEYSGPTPQGVRNVRPFCPGCLVVDGPTFATDQAFGDYLLKTGTFDKWPLVVLVDDARQATESTMSFLWTTFTRFEPAADVKSKDRTIVRNHLAYTPPILIDARKKPWYPDELVCDPETTRLVDRRWPDYGIQS